MLHYFVAYFYAQDLKDFDREIRAQLTVQWLNEISTWGLIQLQSTLEKVANPRLGAPRGARWLSSIGARHDYRTPNVNQALRTTEKAI